ncbi:hypothetical protein IWZ01DRAFT_486389 [Phyllosticta capitalensis]
MLFHVINTTILITSNFSTELIRQGHQSSSSPNQHQITCLFNISTNLPVFHRPLGTQYSSPPMSTDSNLPSSSIHPYDQPSRLPARPSPAHICTANSASNGAPWHMARHVSAQAAAAVTLHVGACRESSDVIASLLTQCSSPISHSFDVCGKDAFHLPADSCSKAQSCRVLQSVPSALKRCRHLDQGAAFSGPIDLPIPSSPREFIGSIMADLHVRPLDNNQTRLRCS